MSKNKFICLIICVGSSIGALGDRRQVNTVGADLQVSRLMYSEDIEVGTNNVAYYSEGGIENACLHTIQEQKMKMSDGGNFDFQCSKVYWVLNAVYTKARRGGRIYMNGTLSSYCMPRTMSEMQIVAKHKACMERPDPTCWDASVLARLDAIKPTVYIDTGDTCSTRKR